MTETGRDVVERLRNGELTVTSWKAEDDFHDQGEDEPEIAEGLAALVEAAQRRRDLMRQYSVGSSGLRPTDFDAVNRDLDEALAALHSQASDEGSDE